MTNRIFIDSSVLIEPLQNRKVVFYKNLISNNLYNCCINSIVVSEYLYKYIGLQNLGSPRTVQENTVISEVPVFMSNYNLLPNDAIILATCKIHNITQLASHDKDFEAACKAEGIELLTEE